MVELDPPRPVAAAVKPPPEPPLELEPLPTSGAAVDAGRAEVAVALDTDGPATITVGTVELHPTPRPVPRPVVPRPHPVVPTERSVAVQPPPHPIDDEVVAAGEARLRIATVPRNAVATAFVNGAPWGPIPADRKMNSGRHTVTLTLADGKKTPAWTGPVRPDHLTVLEYFIDEGRWASSLK